MTDKESAFCLSVSQWTDFSLTGGLFPRPRYPTTERNKMSTDHRENVMKVIEHVREERREIVSYIVERKGSAVMAQEPRSSKI